MTKFGVTHQANTTVGKEMLGLASLCTISYLLIVKNNYLYMKHCVTLANISLKMVLLTSINKQITRKNRLQHRFDVNA